MPVPSAPISLRGVYAAESGTGMVSDSGFRWSPRGSEISVGKSSCQVLLLSVRTLPGQDYTGLSILKDQPLVIYERNIQIFDLSAWFNRLNEVTHKYCKQRYTV